MGEHEAPQGLLQSANRLQPHAEADQGNVGSTAGRELPNPELLHYSREPQAACPK